MHQNVSYHHGLSDDADITVRISPAEKLSSSEVSASKS